MSLVCRLIYIKKSKFALIEQTSLSFNEIKNAYLFLGVSNLFLTMKNQSSHT